MYTARAQKRHLVFSQRCAGFFYTSWFVCSCLESEAVKCAVSFTELSNIDTLDKLFVNANVSKSKSQERRMRELAHSILLHISVEDYIRQGNESLFIERLGREFLPAPAAN